MRYSIEEVHFFTNEEFLKQINELDDAGLEVMLFLEKHEYGHGLKKTWDLLVRKKD